MKSTKDLFLWHGHNTKKCNVSRRCKSSVALAGEVTQLQLFRQFKNVKGMKSSLLEGKIITLFIQCTELLTALRLHWIPTSFTIPTHQSRFVFPSPISQMMQINVALVKPIYSTTHPLRICLGFSVYLIALIECNTRS